MWFVLSLWMLMGWVSSVQHVPNFIWWTTDGPNFLAWQLSRLGLAQPLLKGLALCNISPSTLLPALRMTVDSPSSPPLP